MLKNQLQVSYLHVKYITVQTFEVTKEDVIVQPDVEIA